MLKFIKKDKLKVQERIICDIKMTLITIITMIYLFFCCMYLYVCTLDSLNICKTTKSKLLNLLILTMKYPTLCYMKSKSRTKFSIIEHKFSRKKSQNRTSVDYLRTYVCRLRLLQILEVVFSAAGLRYPAQI